MVRFEKKQQSGKKCSYKKWMSKRVQWKKCTKIEWACYIISITPAIHLWFCNSTFSPSWFSSCPLTCFFIVPIVASSWSTPASALALSQLFLVKYLMHKKWICWCSWYAVAGITLCILMRNKLCTPSICLLSLSSFFVLLLCRIFFSSALIRLYITCLVCLYFLFFSLFGFIFYLTCISFLILCRCFFFHYKIWFRHWKNARKRERTKMEAKINDQSENNKKLM